VLESSVDSSSCFATTADILRGDGRFNINKYLTEWKKVSLKKYFTEYKQVNQAIRKNADFKFDEYLEARSTPLCKKLLECGRDFSKNAKQSL
jgi:hypothetical protein